VRFEESPDIVYGETAHLYDHLPRYANRVDLDFYVSEALRSGGPVLELGCGTGRVLLPTARAGVHVVGLDLAAPMLDVLNKKLVQEPPEIRGRIETILGEMTRFELDRTFPLITTPFRSFQHLLTKASQVACLACVKDHLEPGGRFILDVFQPDAEITEGPHGAPVEDVPSVTLADGRTLRRITRVMATHPESCIADIQMVYELTGPGQHVTRYIQAFKWRYFFREQLEALLAECGFAIRALYGNYDRSPHTDQSPEMVFLVERP
jgi:SAM-dependent methyltransferase